MPEETKKKHRGFVDNPLWQNAMELSVMLAHQAEMAEEQAGSILYKHLLDAGINISSYIAVGYDSKRYNNEFYIVSLRKAGSAVARLRNILFIREELLGESSDFSLIKDKAEALARHIASYIKAGRQATEQDKSQE